MAKKALPADVSDRVTEMLDMHALPGVELSRSSPHTLRVNTPTQTTWMSAFGTSRYFRPSPKRYARAIWSILSRLADPPADDEVAFDWGREWKSVDVRYTPERISVTLRRTDGSELRLSPIDIADQGFVSGTGTL